MGVRMREMVGRGQHLGLRKEQLMLEVVCDGFRESFGVLVCDELEFLEVVRGDLAWTEGDSKRDRRVWF